VYVRDSGSVTEKRTERRTDELTKRHSDSKGRASLRSAANKVCIPVTVQNQPIKFKYKKTFNTKDYCIHSDDNDDDIYKDIISL